VTAFLSKLGLEQCVQAVVHNGFYTSMEALRGATYEELVDSGVRPGHVKLILSHLSSSGLMPPLGPAGQAPQTPTSGASEVASFLRSVGLETCQTALEEAGFGSVEALSRATLKELVGVGIKPVHARLIVSNLDSASTLNAVGNTPAGQSHLSFDDEALLGGGLRKRPRPIRLYAIAAVVGLLFLCGIYFAGSGKPAAPARPSGGGRAGRGGHGGRGGAAFKPTAPLASNPTQPAATGSATRSSTASSLHGESGGSAGLVAMGSRSIPSPAAPGAAPKPLPNTKLRSGIPLTPRPAKPAYYKGKGEGKGGGASDTSAGPIAPPLGPDPLTPPPALTWSFFGKAAGSSRRSARSRSSAAAKKNSS
jgi:hypothetical protein